VLGTGTGTGTEKRVGCCDGGGGSRGRREDGRGGGGGEGVQLQEALLMVGRRCVGGARPGGAEPLCFSLLTLTQRRPSG
jgi:hypothetical protein